MAICLCFHCRFGQGKRRTGSAESLDSSTIVGQQSPRVPLAAFDPADPVIIGTARNHNLSGLKQKSVGPLCMCGSHGTSRSRTMTE